MKITKMLTLLAILSALVVSCHHSGDRSVSLGLIKFSKENISFRDSLNRKTDPASQGINVTVRSDSAGPGLYHLNVTISSDGTRRLRDLEIPITFLAGDPDAVEEARNSFHWAPNLKSKAEDIISQHVFRSPAIILTYRQSAVSIIPDPHEIISHHETPYYLDLAFGKSAITISYGLSNYKTDGHVYYERMDSSFLLPERTELGLYILSSGNSSPAAILGATDSLIWNVYGAGYRKSLLPQTVPFSRYATEGYNMALEKYWINGPRPGTGGIALSTFLDTATGVYRGRDYKDDLWFHSWFNNARTAYGLYLWGHETGNNIWKDKALATMNLLLGSPQTRGFFPTIWVPERNGWVASGQGGGPGLYHVPDNCWTAIWLLRFDDELKKLPGAGKFLSDFAAALTGTQLANGSFPARIHTDDLTPDPILMNSASGSMSTWFLEEMLLRKRLSGDQEKMALSAVSKSLAFLEKEILPEIRFQDFEVFFSCAPNQIDRFDSLTWLYPHNTLSIQWSAEAFLKGYQLFHTSKYLEEGEFCLNILSLYQQAWSPPFIDFCSFGGFGVQNTDAEWSDARQAQFAETYLDYYLITRKREYLQRAVAACHASFALMAIPWNQAVSPQNYRGSAFNGEFRGAMAENFGHSGYNRRSGQSGFHWGTGSALTTAAIFREKLGDIYLDENSFEATGVDGITVLSTDWGDTIRLATKRLEGLGSLSIRSYGKDMDGKLVKVDNDFPIAATTPGKRGKQHRGL